MALTYPPEGEATGYEAGRWEVLIITGRRVVVVEEEGVAVVEGTLIIVGV